jgi:hypothetical protein
MFQKYYKKSETPKKESKEKRTRVTFRFGRK